MGSFKKAPFPFKCFKAGTHPGIKLARHGITKHIALFNWTDQPQYTGYTAADLSLSGQATVRDFWAGEAVELSADNVVELLPPRSSRLFEVLAQR